MKMFSRPTPTLLMAISACALCISTQAKPTQDLAGAISASHILQKSARISVGIVEREATVSIYQSSKEDKELKIEAALIARLLFAKAPNLDTASMVFYDNQNADNVKAVEVTYLDVKAFGKGSVTSSDLLRSLQVISYAKPMYNAMQRKTIGDRELGIDAPDSRPACFTRRFRIAKAIHERAKKGENVDSYRQQLRQIEKKPDRKAMMKPILALESELQLPHKLPVDDNNPLAETTNPKVSNKKAN